MKATTGQSMPPLAREEHAVDHYFGESVIDSYRWMELEPDALKQYATSQDAYTRAVLDAIPGRRSLRTALDSADEGVPRVVLDGVAQQGRVLVYRRAAAGDDRLRMYVSDAGAVREVGADLLEKSTVAVDFVTPSPDGRYLAVGLSSGGTENSVVRVLDVSAGTWLPEHIDRAQYASVSWRDDSRSFYYWRRAATPPGAPREQWFENSHSYLHVLGDDPEREMPILGPSTAGLGIGAKEFSFIRASLASPWAVGYSTSGGLAPVRVFVAKASDGGPVWRTVCSPDAGVTEALSHGGDVYLLTHKDAPSYRILRTSAVDGTDRNATVFVPQSEQVITDMVAARDGLYVLKVDDGVSRLERVSWDGKSTDVPLPAAGVVRNLVAHGDRDGVYFSLSTWLSPSRFWHFDGHRVSRLVLDGDGEEFDTSGLEVHRTTVRSEDGTEVPMTVIAPRGVHRDGSAPAWLHAYGAYGLSTLARFDPKLLVWARRGGVIAYCHVRGGGERGERWHIDGIKAKKENGVSDLIACGEALIARRWTSSRRLTLFGRSAGTVVAGGALTRRPELFASVLLVAPVGNLLRFENTEGGSANVPEFGSVKVNEEFRWLLRSDPYHRVRAGVSYPPVLVAAGENDIRLPLWQAAKLVARLQKNATGSPVLFRVERDAGHGFNATRTQQLDEMLDLMSFALAAAGVLL